MGVDGEKKKSGKLTGTQSRLQNTTSFRRRRNYRREKEWVVLFKKEKKRKKGPVPVFTRKQKSIINLSVQLRG